jgi:hypothetical protein
MNKSFNLNFYSTILNFITISELSARNSDRSIWDNNTHQTIELLRTSSALESSHRQSTSKHFLYKTVLGNLDLRTCFSRDPRSNRLAPTQLQPLERKHLSFSFHAAIYFCSCRCFPSRN